MSDMEMNAGFDFLNDNIEDAPEVPDFVTPPSGFYNLTCQKIAMEKSEENKSAWVQVTWVIDAVNELAKADAEAPAIGSMFSERYYTAKKDGEKSDMGLGAMKKTFAPIAQAFGKSNWLEIFEAAQGAKLSAKVTTKAGKKKTAEGDTMYFTSVGDTQML